MKLKSSIISKYLENNNLEKELCIDGNEIQRQYYKKEMYNIIEDLNILLEQKVKLLSFKNLDILESQEMDSIMKKTAQNVEVLKIENSKIGNLDSYMSAISGKIGKNYSLSEKQYIRNFEYNKSNDLLAISAENLEILSEINRYKIPKMLKIKLFNEKDVKYILNCIDVIRSMCNKKITLVNLCEKNIDLYRYENYINGKIILFQSELIKQSLGLDKLPTYKINQMMYNIRIDGSKINKAPIYVLEQDEEEMFIKDLKEIKRYINIGTISFRNIVFQDNCDIKEAIKEIQAKALLDEGVFEKINVVKTRKFLDIIKEKIYKIFKINLFLNKKQKAFPIYGENN